MNEQVIVSILLLVYNHEPYLKKALDSILKQKTKYSYEILIGNDCSIDGSDRILKQYRESYPDKIRIITPKRNVGATRMFYKLLQNAKGKYIAHLEGDDYWISDEKLNKQVDFLEENKKYVGCSSRCLVIDENDKPIKEKNKEEQDTFWNFTGDEFCLKDFQNGKYAGHFNSLVYRNIFKEDISQARIIYNSHRIIVDRTITLILALHGTIYRMPEQLSCYRMVENTKKSNYQSMTRKKNIRDIEYVYICKLEQYACCRKQENISFYEIKKDKLICATVVMLRQPNIENIGVVFRMLRASHFKGKYMRITICTIFQKLYSWKIMHEDRPVRIKEKYHDKLLFKRRIA